MMALINNKKARLDFELLENYEAGMELLGTEVASLRKGHGSLDGTHVTVRGGEAYILNMEIPAFQPANTPADYDSKRPRRLLLSKEEIVHLAGIEQQKGLTIIPISVYNKNYLKVEIAVARGRKKYDKREVMKKRDAKRDIDRTMKAR